MRFFTRFIIKLIIIVVVVFFALINYRFFSFEKGWSVVNINEDESISAITLIKSMPTKVEYYKKTVSNNEYEYRVYIETNGDSYLLEAKEDAIKTLSVAGLFADDVRPQKIAPIPFYVELIIIIVVLIIPFGRKKH